MVRIHEPVENEAAADGAELPTLRGAATAVVEEKFGSGKVGVHQTLLGW